MRVQRGPHGRLGRGDVGAVRRALVGDDSVPPAERDDRVDAGDRALPVLDHQRTCAAGSDGVVTVRLPTDHQVLVDVDGQPVIENDHPDGRPGTPHAATGLLGQRQPALGAVGSGRVVEVTVGTEDAFDLCFGLVRQHRRSILVVEQVGDVETAAGKLGDGLALGILRVRGRAAAGEFGRRVLVGGGEAGEVRGLGGLDGGAQAGVVVDVLAVQRRQRRRCRRHRGHRGRGVGGWTCRWATGRGWDRCGCGHRVARPTKAGQELLLGALGHGRYGRAGGHQRCSDAGDRSDP